MGRLNRGIEVALWIAALTCIVLAGHFLFPGSERSDGERRSVHIGYVSWAEGIAMTHLAKVILEERMDYEVNLTLADPAPIFASLAEGNLDFFLDAWLPHTHSNHMDEYGDVVNDLGYNYEGARIGLVVPQYVDLTTIPDLSDADGMFGGTITGIDAGAGIMAATRNAIDEYDLDLQLVTSSGAAMTASLSDAVQSEKPIVVTGWKPHWMFSRWQLKFLDDPRKVYGEEENIHTIGRPGVSRDLPELVSFFRRFQFTDQQIGTLMDAINQGASEEAAAREWMSEHADLIDGWLGEDSDFEEQ